MLVPDEVRKCVTFICYRGSVGFKLAGTAFFVSLQTEELNYKFGYVVTAKHVIEGINKQSIDKTVYLRLNIRDGSAKFFETPIDNWLSHPTDKLVDSAVLAWAPPLDVVDIKAVPTSMAATPDVITGQGIGVGDEVFLTGLFVNHFGQKRNTPIVRIGNIALMPEEKINTSWGPIDAFLIEARSIGGLSGSPVFVNMAGLRPAKNVALMSRPRFFWLGLMHGHWDLPISDTDLAVHDSLFGERVNMGIAIVVPVSKILEVINQPRFAAMRKKTEKKLRDKKTPTDDTVKESPRQPIE